MDDDDDDDWWLVFDVWWLMIDDDDDDDDDDDGEDLKLNNFKMQRSIVMWSLTSSNDVYEQHLEYLHTFIVKHAWLSCSNNWSNGVVKQKSSKMSPMFSSYLSPYPTFHFSVVAARSIWLAWQSERKIHRQPVR